MEIDIAKNIKLIVFASLFTALIAMGAYISIPMAPVPMVLANFFVFLAALLLGPVWGTAAAVIYVLIGLAGLPVFSAGKAGFVHFMGPTGGYLLGYILSAFSGGLISSRGKPSISKDCIALIVAALAIYAVGVPWLRFNRTMEWDKALLGGMIPFLIGDGIKIAASVILAKFLRPLMNEYILRKEPDARDKEPDA